MFRKYVGMAVLMIALSPVAAHADWLVTPHFGPSFGADTWGRRHPFWGAAIAWRDAEAFGWEAEVSFAPKFFEGSGPTFDFGKSESNVLSLMVNALVGVPPSGQGGSFQPYVTGGIGLLQVQVVSPWPRPTDRFETVTREVGWDVGAGAMAFMTKRVGLRGDLRYLRSFQNQAPSWTRGIDFDVAPGNFNFFRATVGVTFRFAE
jgi:opacity protein-like surface antigen